MRIIGGKWGGLRINPPKKMPNTRPTTDIAKEGLFNILAHRISFENLDTLDLFAGTGSITYELLSRGAKTSTVVEKDAMMSSFIQNIKADKQIENLSIIQMDVFKYLERDNSSFNFIFAGPPYALTEIDSIPKFIFNKNKLRPGGFFVLEHTPRNDYRLFEHFTFERKYGTTIFSFFEMQSA